MKIVAAFLYSALAFGQIASILTLPPGPITPGQTATIAVSITSTAGSQPAGVQWTTTYSATAFTGAPTWAIAGTAAAAGKILTCRVIATGQIKCLVEGPNQTPIADGTVATINLPLSGTAAPGTTPLALISPVAVGGTGTAITITVPAAVNLPIAALPCDLDASGSVTQADVTIGRNQALGVAACGSADLDSTGNCSVIDVQRLQIAALGAACRVGA